MTYGVRAERDERCTQRPQLLDRHHYFCEKVVALFHYPGWMAPDHASRNKYCRVKRTRGKFRKSIFDNAAKCIVKSDCHAFFLRRQIPAIRCWQHARTTMESVHLAGEIEPIRGGHTMIIENRKSPLGRPPCQTQPSAKDTYRSKITQAK